MKLTKLAGALATAAVMASGAAHAVPTTVLGVTWDPDNFFDFSATSSLYENVAQNTGDLLAGYGRITEINGAGGFCAGCELTYTFSGYTLNAPGIGADGSFSFNGGVFNFYVFAGIASPLNPADYSAGTPWLQLVGADPLAIGTLTGNVTNIFEFSGEGNGYLDVSGGAAAEYFDTNSQTGGTDFYYTSEFQPLNGGTIPGTNITHQGSATITGDSQNVPEPGVLALLGLGFAGIAAARRNKKAA